MEDINNSGASNSSWQSPNQMNYQVKVPNSNGSFVLGIIALCVSVICCICYGSFAGFILSVIGLFLGISAKRKYTENPEMYDPSSFKKAKAGVVLNLIALILSFIVSVILVVLIYQGLNGQLPDEFQEKFDESMRKYQYD